jgi:hypothetical protein
MKRIEANRLRFEIGELAGYLPDELIWEQRLLGKFVDGVALYSKRGNRSKQVDCLRFVVDPAGHVFCDVEPHDLPTDWSVPIDEVVVKALAAVKRIVKTEDFQRLVNAFHTLRLLVPFLDEWRERLRKEMQDCTRAWATDAARRAVKASSE